jgi:hypothetical protein
MPVCCLASAGSRSHGRRNWTRQCNRIAGLRKAHPLQHLPEHCYEIVDPHLCSRADPLASVESERRLYFRIDNGKQNMRPPADKAEWRKLVSVGLENATQEDQEDWVGVATKWEMSLQSKFPSGA